MLDRLSLSTSELLYLMQLSSPALPVGAYSYSEGLEFLVEQKKIANKLQLWNWIDRELSSGSIRLETSVFLRIYYSFLSSNMDRASYWNNWLSAARETTELREQSWQMGQSLMRLIVELESSLPALVTPILPPYNYATIWAIAAAYWQINLEAAIVSYLYSWATNIINAAIKSIPLGQTDGQKLTVELQPTILRVARETIEMKDRDEDLSSFSWGAILASTNHEVQYSRLFRS